MSSKAWCELIDQAFDLERNAWRIEPGEAAARSGTELPDPPPCLACESLHTHFMKGARHGTVPGFGERQLALFALARLAWIADTGMDAQPAFDHVTRQSCIALHAGDFAVALDGLHAIVGFTATGRCRPGAPVRRFVSQASGWIAGVLEAYPDPGLQWRLGLIEHAWRANG